MADQNVMELNDNFISYIPVTITDSDDQLHTITKRFIVTGKINSIVFLGQDFALNDTIFDYFKRTHLLLINESNMENCFQIPTSLNKVQPPITLLTSESVIIPPKSLTNIESYAKERNLPINKTMIIAETVNENDDLEKDCYEIYQSLVKTNEDNSYQVYFENNSNHYLEIPTNFHIANLMSKPYDVKLFNIEINEQILKGRFI